MASLFPMVKAMSDPPFLFEAGQMLLCRELNWLPTQRLG
jgi:hypothetical protein